jgi:hypothetical protein
MILYGLLLDHFISSFARANVLFQYSNSMQIDFLLFQQGFGSTDSMY